MEEVVCQWIGCNKFKPGFWGFCYPDIVPSWKISFKVPGLPRQSNDMIDVVIDYYDVFKPVHIYF